MITSTLKANETKKGCDERNLTSGSTGAGIARLSIVTLDAWFIVCRPVNRGVRFLLNGLAQNIESVILNYNEAEDCLNAHET